MIDDRQTEIHHKELAHAAWRLRSPKTAVSRLKTLERQKYGSSWSAGLRARTASGVKSRPKISRLETLEEAVFQFESRGTKGQMFQFKGVRQVKLPPFQCFCCTEVFKRLNELLYLREDKLFTPSPI